jgi:hypothetical protein
MDFPGALPATFNAPNIDPVKNQQHHGAGPHQEGGGASGEGLSSREPRGSSFLPTSVNCVCCLPTSEENVQADTASRFQLVPDWHLAPRVFHPISTLRDPPQIDLFASCQSAQTRRFYSWKAADIPKAIDALSLRWDFKLAFLFPPIPLLKRVLRKLELSRGTFLLITRYWDDQTWFTSLQALHVEDA